MDVNEVLEFIDNQIFQFKDRHLNDLQRVIIEGTWKNSTYSLIAFQIQYDRGYIAKTASALWNELSIIFGKEINKYNCRSMVEKLYIDMSLGENEFKVERSIEFPPEYWTAGTSILSYFTRILSVKYPDQNIKVKIEQEGLLLRMIIDTPEGTTETIEQTFNDYVMVISRQLPPESLLTDPYEVMALKTKLQIAEMELRITRENFVAFKDDSRQRINSLEMQVSQLFSIIGQSLQKDHHITVNLNQELSNQQRTGDDISGDKVGNDKIGRDKIEGE